MPQTVPNRTKPNRISITPQHGFKVTEILSLWNSTIHPNLPRVELITPKRESALKSLLKTFPEKDWWADYFKKINGSQFLTGENGTGWHCTFDWVINKTNLAKIQEGNYDASIERSRR